MGQDHEGQHPQMSDSENLEQVYNERGEALSEIWHTFSELYDSGLKKLLINIQKDVDKTERVKMIGEFMNKFCNQGDGSQVDTFIDILSGMGGKGTEPNDRKKLISDELFDRIVDLDTDIVLLAGRTARLSRIPIKEEQKDHNLDEAIDYLHEFQYKMEELVDLMEVSLDFFKVNVH